MTELFEDALRARLAKAIPDVADLDWLDVRRRARRPLKRTLLVASLALALAIGVSAPAFGLHRIVVGFFEADPAPQRVQLAFDRFGIAAPVHLDPQVIPGSARKVLVEVAEGESQTLYLAPTKRGGFCFQWDTFTVSCRTSREDPGGRPEHQDDVNTYRLGLHWEPDTSGALRRFAGNLIAKEAELLTVEFADGNRAEIPVTWVSKPIDAGFYLYDVPERHQGEGRHVTAVVAMDRDGDVVARQSFRLVPPDDREQPARLPNGEMTSLPANAMPGRARRLIDFEGFRGDRITLWLVPRRDGRSCYAYNRVGGCPPHVWKQPTPFSGGISGGPTVLFFGQVLPEVAVVQLRYEDGTRKRLKPVAGFVLYEVPPGHYAPGHRLVAAVALAANGRVLAQQAYDPGMAGVYPCGKPMEMGKGVTACP